MNDEIRGLSVRQPWAWGICAGVKRTENWTWTTDRRGTIAIHASTSAQVVNNLRKQSGCKLMAKESFSFGAIIGLADIVDVASYGIRHEDDPFAEGPYCWTMANSRFLKEPIPLKGKLNLFKIKRAIQQQLRSAEIFTVDFKSNTDAKKIADAMTSEPDPVASYLELVEEFYRTNNHMDAMTVAGDRLIALAPNEPSGYLIRAAMRISDPEAKDCSELMRRSTELDPAFGLGWYFLAEACLKENEPEKAVEAASELIRLQPETGHGFETRARAYFQAKQFKSAITDCDVSLKMDPQWANSWTLRAEAKVAIGDHEGATKDIAEAIRLSPKDPKIADAQRQILVSK